MSTDSLIEKTAEAIKNSIMNGAIKTFDQGSIQITIDAIALAKAAIAAMGGVYGVPHSSAVKPEAMGSPVSDKDDNLAPPTSSLIEKLEAFKFEQVCNAGGKVDFWNQAVDGCIEIALRHMGDASTSTKEGVTSPAASSEISDNDPQIGANIHNIFAILWKYIPKDVPANRDDLEVAAMAIAGAFLKPASTNGISNIDLIEKMCLAAWGVSGKVDKTTQVSIMEDALDAIRPYLRTSKPVMVSLDDIVEIYKKPGLGVYEGIKAVLDSLKEQGVEFDYVD